MGKEFLHDLDDVWNEIIDVGTLCKLLLNMSFSETDLLGVLLLPCGQKKNTRKINYQDIIVDNCLGNMDSKMNMLGIYKMVGFEFSLA